MSMLHQLRVMAVCKVNIKQWIMKSRDESRKKPSKITCFEMEIVRIQNASRFTTQFWLAVLKQWAIKMVKPSVLNSVFVCEVSCACECIATECISVLKWTEILHHDAILKWNAKKPWTLYVLCEYYITCCQLFRSPGVQIRYSCSKYANKFQLKFSIQCVHSPLWSADVCASIIRRNN